MKLDFSSNNKPSKVICLYPDTQKETYITESMHMCHIMQLKHLESTLVYRCEIILMCQSR